MRYVAIFSFTEMEGVVGSPERTKQLYGRVLPIHLERAGMRGDALVDWRDFARNFRTAADTSGTRVCLGHETRTWIDIFLEACIRSYQS